MLFCDVRDFTSFADALEREGGRQPPQRAVRGRSSRSSPATAATWTSSSATACSASSARPSPIPDHADRAVLAACEMASKVNSRDDLGLKIGVGVNTGLVVAGSIGGGGRLNFSVIGDAVNVAARVEAATREVGEDVLITAWTAERVSVLDPGRELRRADPEGDRRARGALHAACGVRGPAARRGAAAGPRRDAAPRREFGDSRREAGGLAQL